MHIYFSGIGGAGIGPLAIIAQEAGFQVTGSDKQDSQYVHYLKDRGISVQVGQDYESIQAVHTTNPIDWYVYSSAVVMENPDFPELKFCKDNNINSSKRDDFINYFLEQKKLNLITIAGTHGKTTTTAMMIWLMKQVGIPISYSLGAKISFGHMGHFNPESQYFVYEADEFDHNFMAFHPQISLISGIDYDHPDIYPTREEYEQAFRDYIGQAKQTILWQKDAQKLAIEANDSVTIMPEPTSDESLSTLTVNKLSLLGEVNRRDAALAIEAVKGLTDVSDEELITHMNRFPGLSRRFEEIAPNVYSDYAHTPEKIRGAIQIAQEKAADNLVIVYEGLHNTRQHFIKEELSHLFDSAKQLYIVPSYLAREDKSLELLTPEKLVALTSQPEKATPKQLDDDLKATISGHAESGDLVLCLTAGGGQSLDEWLRKGFVG